MKNKKYSNFLGVTLSIVLMVNIFYFVSATSDTTDLGDYLVNYSYSNANAGDKFTLTVTVTNTDNEDKSDIELKLNFDYPFSKVNDKNWDIGEIKAGESVSNSFRIEVDEDAESGNHDLNFKIEDSDDDYEDDFKIDITSDKAELVLNELESTPKKITPSQDEITLEVKIQNKGDKSADYTKAKLILPDGFSSLNSYSDTVTLNTISADGIATATFYIKTDENLVPANYQAKLQLDYESDGDKETTYLSLDLPVMSVPQFSIISSSPLEVKQGEDATLKINVKNIGEEKGESTSVRIFEKSSQPFDFDDKNSEIGTLEPSESGVATFGFSTDKDATPSKYLIAVQIRTISNGEVITYDKTIPVTVVEKTTNPIIYILSGMVILIGVVGYLIFKIRK